MNFLVIGCGSIGRRHIRNIKSLGHSVTGCERDASRARQVEKEYGIKVFPEIKKAMAAMYDGAFICTPTASHVPVAIETAKRGIHLFIEKPLSDNLKRVDELSKLAAKKHLAVLVGCNMRFLPSLKLVRKLIQGNRIGKVLFAKVECGFYLPYWHPYEDYRKGYSANKKLGGGVIFDDIHEIDYLYWLFKDVNEVFCYADKISRLQIDTEDVAEILLKFKSGVAAQVHMDYIQRTYRRYYEFIGETGVIVWDYASQNVELFTEKPNHKEVLLENINTNIDTMFIEEVRHFIDCINGREKPVNDISSARKVLETVLACHKSAALKKVIRL